MMSGTSASHSVNPKLSLRGNSQEIRGAEVWMARTHNNQGFPLIFPQIVTLNQLEMALICDADPVLRLRAPSEKDRTPTSDDMAGQNDGDRLM